MIGVALIVVVVLGIIGTLAVLPGDRPRTPPRSARPDPVFLPPGRWE